ncbi:hypothetical protein KGQ34_03050 [Patescibacteria group bacterium]|nr:hypothetical protein [Patescibacteria group bacterium]
MRQSKLFGKTLREDPKDEISANARLLERAGFIYKTMAGVYDYLPLGLKVLDKINEIIREEMNAIGGQELFLSAFQPKERWQKTGRWETGNEVMYQFKDNSGHSLGLAWTHEEAITEIATRFISSHKDLPLFLYQIQTKFRDEPRAKSGLIRGREFLMKDLYSFHTDEKDLERFYDKARDAYLNIFRRCDLSVYVTEASGGTFTKSYSHEFQVLSDAGEDWLFYCKKCGYAQNKEIAKIGVGHLCPKCKGKIEQGRSIEVGNIFKLGVKFSEPFGLLYADEKGKKYPVVMGSYGIGPGRLMGTIVETHRDERGMMWPDAVAPYRVHIIELLGKEKVKKVKEVAEKLHQELLAKGIEPLYDDREEKSAGEKFADADLLGIPWRVVVSEKTLEKSSAEVKRRDKQQAQLVKLSQLKNFLAK